VSTVQVRHGDATVELPEGSTVREALGRLGVMRSDVIAARVVRGDAALPEEWDLDRAFGDGEVVLDPIRAATPEGRDILRHSTAHVMAQAVTDLFPEAKWAIGPPVQDGFYYDFDVERPFTPEDIEAIEARMRELLVAKQRFVRAEVTRDEALAMFADQPYKREVIERVEPSEVDVAEGRDEPTFTVYRNVAPDGEEAWVDLCRGPHLGSTDRIPAFKLLRTAGAYWRGREDQPMLQRIYGTAWESQQALDDHLRMLEEARARDHRRLGRELGMLHMPEELGPGLAIFLPKGAHVRRQMEDWIREETLARGYEPVYTPHVAKEDLWRISGHLENYGDLMFPGMEVEHATYRLKPMNCPFHILAYTSRTRSYRELPLRISELGTVYRFERSGVVNGMLRARGFTQDDSHIFCRPDQVVDEIVGCITFARDLYRAFGLGEPSRVAVSTRPEKSIGTTEQWERAERALMDAAAPPGTRTRSTRARVRSTARRSTSTRATRSGASGSSRPSRSTSTSPGASTLSYVGEDGQKHEPFMVHRALFGSIERFFAVLLESTNGAFPLWLAPEQVRVVPVAGDFTSYAEGVATALRERGLRVEVDTSDDTLGARIRSAQTEKVPVTLIVGSDEQAAGTVAVRRYGGDQRKAVPLGELAEELVSRVGRWTARRGTGGHGYGLMALRARFPHLVASVVGPLGRGLARSGVRPNTLTTVGLLLTVGSAFIIGSGRPLLGALVLFIGGSMDALDGTVARATGNSTPFGAFYDSVSDRISDGVVLAGVAWWVADRPRLLLLTLASLVLAEVTSYVRARAESIDLTCEVGVIERAERAHPALIGLLFAPLLEPVLWLLAIGGAITVAQRMHHVWCQIDRDLPAEIMALAHADRAWSRAVRPHRARVLRRAQLRRGVRRRTRRGARGGRTERLRERLALAPAHDVRRSGRARREGRATARA
jgi:threonyl-tRNA synthetase